MIEIKKVETEKELSECFSIRKCVFGYEEETDEHLYKKDKYDRISTTKNFLLKLNSKSIATGRYIEEPDRVARVQRMAILKEFRRKYFASLLISFMEEDMRRSGYISIILNSASKVKPFYLKNGFSIVSEEFYEDGRPHITMSKSIK